MATSKTNSCGECGCGNSSGLDPVWEDPSQYDVAHDGPSYLKEAATRPAPKGVIPKLARMMARRASLAIQPAAATLLSKFGTTAKTSSVAQGLPLVDFLKVVNAVALIHHTAHWRTSGPQYYADHLLFDRCYSDVQAHVDMVAERAIGLGAGELVTAEAIATGTLQAVEAITARAMGDCSPQGLVRTSLEATKVLLSSLGVVLATLKRAGNLTDGTANMLQGLADMYESHMYLLGQRSGS